LRFTRAWAVSLPTRQTGRPPKNQKYCANHAPPQAGRTAGRRFTATFPAAKSCQGPDFCHLADRQDRGFFVSSQINEKPRLPKGQRWKIMANTRTDWGRL